MHNSEQNLTDFNIPLSFLRENDNIVNDSLKIIMIMLDEKEHKI